MVYGVAPLGVGCLLEVAGSVLFGDPGDLRRRAAQADDLRVKERRVFLQPGSGVALGVDRDEDALDALAFIRCEFGKRLRQQRQRGRADIRALGEAEVDENHLAAKVAQPDVPLRSLQGELCLLYTSRCV